MTWDTVLDILSGVLLIGGAFLSFIAGLGLVRFRDLLVRMHAATKPQVLGLMMLMTGLAIELRSLGIALSLVLVVVFQLVTAPISAHMLSRAGYRTGKVDFEALVVDEYAGDLERAEKLDALEREEIERAREREEARREDKAREAPEASETPEGR